MYKNTVSVKINCYKGFDYTDTLEGISKAGFKYLELSTSKGNSLNLSQDMNEEELDLFKKDLAKYGLVPIALGGGSFIMDDDTSKILNNIKLAKYLGAKYVVTTIFNARNDADLLASDKEVAEKIKYYLPYLIENDLCLVIELHGRYATGTIVKKILDLVSDRHVLINYDTGNALYWGKLNVDEMLNDFEGSISDVGYLHLKDKLGANDEWNFPAIGSGYIPFKDIFEILKKHNNQSNVSVEIEFTENGVDTVEEVNDNLNMSANYLKSLGLILK